MSNAGLHDRLGECLCGQILIYHALGGVFVVWFVCLGALALLLSGGAGVSSVVLLFFCPRGSPGPPPSVVVLLFCLCRCVCCCVCLPPGALAFLLFGALAHPLSVVWCLFNPLTEKSCSTAALAVSAPGAFPSLKSSYRQCWDERRVAGFEFAL